MPEKDTPTRQKGAVLNFLVQLEVKVKGTWKPSSSTIRAHDFNT